MCGIIFHTFEKPELNLKDVVSDLLLFAERTYANCPSLHTQALADLKDVVCVIFPQRTNVIINYRMVAGPG